jgi:hypothetical protein
LGKKPFLNKIIFVLKGYINDLKNTPAAGGYKYYSPGGFKISGLMYKNRSKKAIAGDSCWIGGIC